jgi:hypothetical protein
MYLASIPVFDYDEEEESTGPAIPKKKKEKGKTVKGIDEISDFFNGLQ